MYGWEVKFPVDAENLEEETSLNDRIKNLIWELLLKRETARQSVEVGQSKQKLRHDKKLRNETQFKIGDKVLYYEAAKEK